MTPRRTMTERANSTSSFSPHGFSRDCGDGAIHHTVFGLNGTSEAAFNTNITSRSA